MLAGASIDDVQDVIAGLRGARQGSKNARDSARSSRPRTGSRAVEMNAASVVAHLKEHGPLCSKHLRAALGISRADGVKVLALASDWNAMTKSG